MFRLPLMFNTAAAAIINGAKKVKSSERGTATKREKERERKVSLNDINE